MTYKKRAKSERSFEKKEVYTELQIIEEITAHICKKKGDKISERSRLLKKLKTTRESICEYDVQPVSFPNFVSEFIDKLRVELRDTHVEEEKVILEKLRALGWREEQE